MGATVGEQLLHLRVKGEIQHSSWFLSHPLRPWMGAGWPLVQNGPVLHMLSGRRLFPAITKVHTVQQPPHTLCAHVTHVQGQLSEECVSNTLLCGQ